MAANRSFFACLQSLHRLGGFWSCLSRKKICSPTVQINSLLQSIHVIERSWNSGASGETAAPLNPSNSLTDIIYDPLAIKLDLNFILVRALVQKPLIPDPTTSA